VEKKIGSLIVIDRSAATHQRMNKKKKNRIEKKKSLPLVHQMLHSKARLCSCCHNKPFLGKLFTPFSTIDGDYQLQ